MTTGQLMGVLQRYLELRASAPLTNPVGNAGTGGCDGVNTGGVKGTLLFMCEVGKALQVLSHEELRALDEYMGTWMEHGHHELEAMEPGASAMPGAPWHRREERTRRRLRDLRGDRTSRAAIIKLSDELDRRMQRNPT